MVGVLTYIKHITGNTKSINALIVGFIPQIISGCGIPNSNGMARIVNGYPTGHNEFPWIAALHRTGPFRKNKDSIGGFCGGALVSDLYVITAGHCIARYTEIT